MLSEAMTDRQVVGQPEVLFFRVRKAQGVVPFLAESLCDPLSFVVGSGRVRLGVDVPNPQNLAGFGEWLGDVGRAVVSHHKAELNPLTVEPGKHLREEADHR